MQIDYSSPTCLRRKIDVVAQSEAELRPLVHGYLVILFDADAYRPSEGPKACSGSNPEQVGGGLSSISPCPSSGTELKKGGGPNPSEADTFKLSGHISPGFAPRYNTSSSNFDPRQAALETFPSREPKPIPDLTPIGPRSFQLPGLGVSGPLCRHQQLSHFSSDGKAARYKLFSCRRVVCPDCWKDWARRTTFELAMRIEAYARSTGDRPYRCVFSVSPEQISQDAWNWPRINTSLFRRGYRRSGEHGVDGGFSIFHPFRIRPQVKRRLRKSKVHNGTGMWKVIREWVEDGADLLEFASFGPHVHSIVFGEPEAHRCADFVLVFDDDDNHVPRQLATTEDLVKFLRYLLSHVGVLMQFKVSGNGPQERSHRQKTHAIRSFGCLHGIDPKLLLPPSEYVALAQEIAGLLGMEYVDGELRYPAKSRDIDANDEGIEWIPIYKLSKYLASDDWYSLLSTTQAQFWDRVLFFTDKHGRPPDWGDIGPPTDVLVFEAKPLDDKSENDEV